MSTPDAVVIDRNDLVGHDNFMQVRRTLVSKLGGGMAAMAAAAVLSAIEFQMSYGREGQTYDRDGRQWWRASLDLISDWTGMGRTAVHRSVDYLVKRGVLERAEHKRGGRADRTKSYRIVLADEPAPDEAVTQIPDAGSADSGSGTSGDSGSGISLQIPDAESAPSIREGDGERGRGRPRTPLDKRFPDQCSRHQTAEHDEPCGACGKARKRYESYLVDQAQAAQQAAAEAAAERCQVDGHEHYPAINCPGCRADRLAAS